MRYPMPRDPDTNIFQNAESTSIKSMRIRNPELNTEEPNSTEL
jgi:hypothetical protein